MTSAGVAEYNVLYGASVKAIDEAAIRAGTPSEELMESAGAGAAAWIIEHRAAARVVVLAGPGGNGGDALVVARHLHGAGYDVRSFVVGGIDRLRGSSRAVLRKWTAAGGHVQSLDEGGLGLLESEIREAELVVDGLFGIGVTRPLEGPFLDVVNLVNAATVHTVALDLPSGVPADTGTLLGESIRADATLAMAFLKPAHLLFPARGRCGDIVVTPVAYPADLAREIVPWARVVTPWGVRRRLPERRPDGHKGTFGRVLVVAGSCGMTGAAILCCRGALRSGAGLVSLAGPASLHPIFEASLPEVLTHPLPDCNGRLTAESADALMPLLQQADVVILGPGLSRGEEIGTVVERAVDRYAGPMVLDADALNALAGRKHLLASLRGRAVLTPHPGEHARLSGGAGSDRLQLVSEAQAFAAQHGVVLVLKGRPTAIGHPAGDIYLNPTGNTGLATGGSGDVLAGMVGGLAAGGASLEDAAIAAVYIHGHAADVYARDRAPRAMIPSDLIDLLPSVFREIERWT